MAATLPPDAVVVDIADDEQVRASTSRLTPPLERQRSDTTRAVHRHSENVAPSAFRLPPRDRVGLRSPQGDADLDLPTFSGPTINDFTAGGGGGPRRESDRSTTSLNLMSGVSRLRNGSSGTDSLNRSSSFGSVISMMSSTTTADGRTIMFQRKPGAPEKVGVRLYGILEETRATATTGASTLMLAVDQGSKALLTVRDTEIIQGPRTKADLAACKQAIRALGEINEHPNLVTHYSVDLFKRGRRIVVASSAPESATSAASSQQPTPMARSTNTEGGGGGAKLSSAQLPSEGGDGGSSAMGLTLTAESIGSTLRQRQLSLVCFMEFVPGRPLSSVLRAFADDNDIVPQVRCASPTLTRDILRKVMAALEHLHKNELVHGLLSTANIYFTIEREVKVTGVYGTVLYDYYDNSSIDQHTRARFMAPEVLRLYKKGAPLEDIDFAADIWSIGCVAFELLTSQQPFPKIRTASDLLLAISSPNLNVAEEHAPMFQMLSEAARDFILLCLKRRPQERATLEVLLAHPFIEPMGSKTSSSSLGSSGRGGGGGGGTTVGTTVGAANPISLAPSGAHSVHEARRGDDAFGGHVEELTMEDIVGDEEFPHASISESSNPLASQHGTMTLNGSQILSTGGGAVGGSSVAFSSSAVGGIGAQARATMRRRVSIADHDIQRYIFREVLLRAPRATGNPTLTSPGVSGALNASIPLTSSSLPQLPPPRLRSPIAGEEPTAAGEVTLSGADDSTALRFTGELEDAPAAGSSSTSDAARRVFQLVIDADEPDQREWDQFFNFVNSNGKEFDAALAFIVLERCLMLDPPIDSSRNVSTTDGGTDNLQTRSVGSVRFVDIRQETIARTAAGRSVKPSTSMREFCMTFICCCFDDPGQVREMRRRRRRRTRFGMKLVGIPVIVVLFIGVILALVFVVAI